MLSPQDIYKKATRKYLQFLKSWLVGDDFSPLEISVGGANLKDYLSLQAEVSALKSQSKDSLGYGYIIESETKRTRNFGEQTIPRRISFEHGEDFLRFIGKSKEFDHFMDDVDLIRTEFPNLEEWLLAHSKDVIKYHGDWHDILLVCQYFQRNPLPNLYIRELPIKIHTKFIETHKGILRSLLDFLLPDDAYYSEESNYIRRYGLREKPLLVRLRFLDDALHKKSDIPFKEFAIPITMLAEHALPIRCCVIVENELNFLTLPSLSETLAIWGEGYKVEILECVAWLHDITMIYWGDIDAQGFQILSNLRGKFPNVHSIMMDATTFDTFDQYIVAGTPSMIAELPNLTLDERAVFNRVQSENLRLEQEHIGQLYGVEALQNWLNSI